MIVEFALVGAKRCFQGRAFKAPPDSAELLVYHEKDSKEAVVPLIPSGEGPYGVEQRENLVDLIANAECLRHD